jgi:uncharacterized protein YoaH (UPF0181 family)
VSETPTIEEQGAHLEKLKALGEKIHEYESSGMNKYEAIYFGSEELDTIKRAVACHMAVITLDMKNRKAAAARDKEK